MSKQIELSRKELLLITVLVGEVGGTDLIGLSGYDLWSKLRESLGFKQNAHTFIHLHELGINRPKIETITLASRPKAAEPSYLLTVNE